MPYPATVTKAKDDGFSFQDVNNINTRTDYLKTQSEIVVDEDGTAVRDSVIPAASLQAGNSPQEGALLTARAAETGDQKWESIYENEDFWAFN